MGSVRIALQHPRPEEHESVVLARVSSFARRSTSLQMRMETFSVLDIVCVVGILALAAIVALVGRGVEKL
jgi:hypothetical protein